MRTRDHVLRAFLLAAALLTPAAARGQGAASSRPRVVAYVPNWVDLKSFVDTIDYPKLTHINVAFENPKTDAGDLSFSSKNDLLIAKARANGVKVLVSIGGGAASGDKVLRKRYADLLADPAKRAGFVAKLAAYVGQHGFDGLDVDIEGPAITAGYGELVAELAAALKPAGGQPKLL
ncbi:MAG: glycoside hydrolase family protein, partial [Phycisphaerales bacterium]|nr:glycoside hydrolase family protein [Phycisphaerales bacterium]